MENYYDALLQYALRLIVRKRYTEKEIRKKLVSKKVGGSGDIEKVAERLKELKYIDDKAFVRDYISTRSELNPRGKQLLKIELKMKGVDSRVIADGLEKACINEDLLANKIVKKYEKRFADLGKLKKKEKIMRLLISRGFKPDTIYKIMDRC